MPKLQRKRNLALVWLYRSGESQVHIAEKLHITRGRVNRIIARARLLEGWQAKLEAKYGAHPKIHKLPNSTPIEVLVLCNKNVHGWVARIMNLRNASRPIRTLGGLRRTPDAHLLREPKIGPKLVAQLREVCPFHDSKNRSE